MVIVCHLMRIPILAAPAATLTVHGWAADELAAMKHDVKLFTDRGYVIGEMPDALRDRPLLRMSIEALDDTGKIRATSPSITGDRTKLPVERENCFNRSDMHGKPERLRFHLTSGGRASPGVRDTSTAIDQ